MDFVYERCGHCARKGAYAVPGRDIVRCKYCTAFAPAAVHAGSSLLDAARALESAAPSRRRPHRESPLVDDGTNDLRRRTGVLTVESWAMKAPADTR